MNPFRDRAIRARALADRLNRPTAREQAMADAFPLGPGFGRPGAGRRVDASVSRAVKAVDAERQARALEAKADAFDRGEVNAQGRRWSPAQQARADRRSAVAAQRDARIEAARAQVAGREPWEVPAEVWADASGSLAGSARQLVLADHREAVARARAAGLTGEDS